MKTWYDVQTSTWSVNAVPLSLRGNLKKSSGCGGIDLVLEFQSKPEESYGIWVLKEADINIYCKMQLFAGRVGCAGEETGR